MKLRTYFRESMLLNESEAFNVKSVDSSICRERAQINTLELLVIIQRSPSSLHTCH